MSDIKVKISDGSTDGKLIRRQTPGSSFKWKNIEFFCGDKYKWCDWWVVLHGGGLTKEEQIVCDPNHLIFASMEPPEMMLPREFYAQFSQIITCDPKIKHKQNIPGNIHTWWAGIKIEGHEGRHTFDPIASESYDSFSNMQMPTNKKNRISIITSSKDWWSGHKDRLNFIDRLKHSSIAPFIDLYGFGNNPIEDKLSALLPYKYHISLENSVHTNYWSEKLADSYLGYCLPFYHGCPNISQFFPKDAMIKINIKTPLKAIKIIEESFHSDIFSRRAESISAARSKVLDSFNLFAQLANICGEPASFTETCSLKPLTSFEDTSQPKNSKLTRAINKIKRALS